MIFSVLMASAGLCLAAAAPAYAGFGWNPPASAAPVHHSPADDNDGPANPGPKVMAAPSIPVDAVQTPVPVMNGGIPAVPEPLPPMEAGMPMDASDLPPGMATGYMPAPMPVSAATIPPVMDEPQYEEIQGFGDDIPLVMAMSQIVPTDYSYSFDPAVNPGLPVDWNGGKPWDRVLKDSLAPFGLSVEIVGQTVWVRSGPPQEMRLQQAAIAAPRPVTPAAPQPLFNDNESMMPLPLVPGGMNDVNWNTPQATANTAQDFYGARGLEDDASYHPSYPRRNPMNPLVTQSALQEKQGSMPPLMPEMASRYPMSGADSEMYLPAMPVYDGPLPPAARTAALDDMAAPTPLAPMAAMTPMTPPPQAALPAGASATLDPIEIRYWQAASGESLRSVLSRWSEDSGIEMVWRYEGDFPLLSPLRMHGTYTDAVAEILKSYQGSPMQPQAKFYPNLPNGPSVLVVSNNMPYASN